MLPGIVVHPIQRRVDERGFFAEVMRADWMDLLDRDQIVQVNLSWSYPGVVRGWHRHTRGQVDYFLVLQGSLRICAYDDGPASATKGQLTQVVASALEPALVRIPGHYWHGTLTLGDQPSLTVYFTNRLYDHSDPDEERRPWNDARIVDPETREPYQWHRPVHR